MTKYLAAVLALLSTAALAQPSVQPGPGPQAVGVTPFVATGGTTNASAADRFGLRLNAKTDFGARFDATSGTATSLSSGSTALSASANPFNCATDVGKKIWIGGVGTGGATLFTSISACSSSGTITLTDAASASAGQFNASSIAIVTDQSGSGSYAPGDDITLAGGTSTVATVAHVQETHVTSATVVSAGTGGADSACILTGTTGTGNKFQINATISGGAITALGSFVTFYGAPMPGFYTANPTNLSGEPVSSTCGLSGATLSLKMGVANVVVKTAGVYSVQPTSGTVTQASTTGSGTGFAGTAIYSTAGAFTFGTDDAAAIQTGLNALCTAKGGLLTLPAGSSVIASKLVVGCSNVGVVGTTPGLGYQSWATTLTWAGPVGGTMLLIGQDPNPTYGVNTSHVYVSGFKLDGNAGRAAIGSYIESLKWSEVSLGVQNTSQYGVDLTTVNMTIGNDTQGNLFEFHVYNSKMPGAEGVAFIQGQAGNGDVSINQFKRLYVEVQDGWALHFYGNGSDNNIFHLVDTFSFGIPAGQGKAIRIESGLNSGNTFEYVQPGGSFTIAPGTGGVKIASFDSSNSGFTPSCDDGTAMCAVWTDDSAITKNAQLFNPRITGVQQRVNSGAKGETNDYMLWATTTTGATAGVFLTTDGQAETTANCIPLPANASAGITIRADARDYGGSGSISHWNIIQGTVNRVATAAYAGDAATALAPTFNNDGGSPSIVVQTNNSRNCLEVYVKTGTNAQTIINATVSLLTVHN